MLYIDFESLSECDIKKSGADAYARHHTTSVICMAFAFDDEKPTLYVPEFQLSRAMSVDPIPYEITTALPDRVIEHVQSGGLVVAHNAPFDCAIWNHCTSWPKLAPEQLDDTSAKACAMALPASLGALGDALGVELKKNPSGTRLITKMCTPPFLTSPALMAEMLEYCARDVESMREINGRLRPLNPTERQVWLVNHKANQNGVYLDYDLICNSIYISGQEDIVLEKKAQALAGVTSKQLRSPAQLLKWCESQGVMLPNLSKDTLATAKIANPLVEKVLDLRAQVCRSSIKKFDKMLAVMCPDGRARGNHVYHRATTGRFAGAGVQVQNLPRPSVDDTDTLADFISREGALPEGLSVDPKTALTSVLRSCIMAPKGSEFYCADYSAIESRVLFWLAGEEKGLDVYRGGADLYCVTAGGIFGYPCAKKTHPNERAVGKVAVLSLGYGGGVQALQGMCDMLGVDLMGKDPADIRDRYRGTFPKVKQFWSDCEQAAIEAIKQPDHTFHVRHISFRYVTSRQSLACRLPSGRLIHWPFTAIDKGATTPWGSKTTQVVYKGVNIARKWVNKRTYGGDIAQSATQAVARDMLAHAMLTIDQAGFKIVLHVHDEIMVEMPTEANRYEEFSKLMSTPAPWATDCPIAVEGWVGNRYQK